MQISYYQRMHQYRRQRPIFERRLDYIEPQWWNNPLYMRSSIPKPDPNISIQVRSFSDPSHFHNAEKSSDIRKLITLAEVLRQHGHTIKVSVYSSDPNFIDQRWIAYADDNGQMSDWELKPLWDDSARYPLAVAKSTAEILKWRETAEVRYAYEHSMDDWRFAVAVGKNWRMMSDDERAVIRALPRASLDLIFQERIKLRDSD